MITIAKRYTLRKGEVEKLANLVNTGRQYKIDLESPAFVDRIIELYFEQQGLDFWTMPEVTEWSTKDREITFSYIE